jgi:predicted acyl esterase
MSNFKSEVRDSMRIDWDVSITMDDGLVLRADVYRPIREGKYPVIMSYGPYGKWLHFEDLYTDQWRPRRPGGLHEQVSELGSGGS